MPFLRIIKGRGSTEGDHFEVKGPRTTIGHSRDNEVEIQDNEVSERHAEIVMVGDCHVIRDLGSTNGTFVNEVRVADKNGVRVNPDDKIRVGKTTLLFGERTVAKGDPNWLSGVVKAVDYEQIDPRQQKDITEVESTTPIKLFEQYSPTRASLFDVITSPSEYSEDERRLAIVVLYTTYRGPLEKHAHREWEWLQRKVDLVHGWFEGMLANPAGLAGYKKFDENGKHQKFRLFLKGAFQHYCRKVADHIGTIEAGADAQVFPGGTGEDAPGPDVAGLADAAEPKTSSARPGERKNWIVDGVFGGHPRLTDDEEYERDCALEDLADSIGEARRSVKRKEDAWLSVVFEDFLHPDEADPERPPGIALALMEIPEGDIKELRNRVRGILREEIIATCRRKHRVVSGSDDSAVAQWLLGALKRGWNEYLKYAAGLERITKEPKAQELLKKAEKRENGNDLPTAIQQYKKLIKAYPKSDAAKKAEERLRALQGEEGEKDPAG